MNRFKAFRIYSEGGRVAGRFEELGLEDLAPGDVVIRVTHSGINYKDALAATGAGKILRRYPLVGGIDLAGVVESSSDPRFAPGAAVLVTGCGLSETHDGGYAQFARVPGDWVIPMPAGLDAATAMALGTAGFTAALAIHRMEQNGQSPTGGPIAVTGASGGVGSLAIDMLSARGYRVTAVSGKADAAPYLRELGASEVLLRESIDFGSRPLENARFGGAIDNLGTMRIDNSIIGSNLSYGVGGAVKNSGFLNIGFSTISGNFVVGDGGGIYNTPTGSLGIFTSTLSGNTASQNGGGLWNSGDVGLFSDTITLNVGNRAADSLSHGGGHFLHFG